MSLILSGTDGLSDVDGTAATPAIRGTDANTGIFFPAADTIAFAEGGVEAARFDSAGNFLVGTATPAQKLTVAGGLASSSGISALAASTAFFDYNSGNGRFAAVSATTGTAAPITLSQYSSNGSVGRDAVTIDTNGGLKAFNTIGVGNTTPSTSGAGITFPATQSASSDANTLDDYEEGTWTPLVQNASATESASAGANGTYVKVGKMVYVTINMYALNVSGITASSHLYIRGLPFEISYGNAQALFMVYPAVPVSTVDVSSTQLPLYISNNATDYSQFSRNSWGGASSITLRGCFVYQSAA